MIFTPFAFMASQVAPAPGFLLDDYPGAVGAYSVRLLDSTYVGSAFQVRRSSDNATLDIGFDGSGDLDVSAMETFVGANDGFVTTWYDQSGNGNDTSQADTTQQPKIVSTGTTIRQNGIPTLEFTNDFFERANIISSGADKTLFSVHYPTAINPGQCILDLSEINSAGQSWNLTAETALRCQSRTYVTTVGSNNTYALLEMWQNGLTIDDAAQFKMYYNGNFAPRTSGANGNITNSTGDFNIGFSINGAQYFAGNQQEIVIYPSSLIDATREGVRDNVNAYYSIY